MKNSLLTTISSGLILLLCSCSKKESKPASSSPIFITGRVIEYGSGLPLSDVDFYYDVCIRPDYFSCAESHSDSLITNTKGLLTTTTESLFGGAFEYSYSFSKDGYWYNAKNTFQFTYLPPGSDYPPISFFPDNSANIDSFQVRLFPKVNINIHVANKNINSAETAVIFQCRANFSPGLPQREEDEIKLMIRKGFSKQVMSSPTLYLVELNSPTTIRLTKINYRDRYN